MPLAGFVGGRLGASSKAKAHYIFHVIPAHAGIRTAFLSFPRKRESSLSFCHSRANGNRDPLCHSRESGNPDLATTYWMPVFTGMTTAYHCFPETRVFQHSRMRGIQIVFLSFPRKRESGPPFCHSRASGNLFHTISLYKSRQVGLFCSINSIFHLRYHFFNCFSRLMAERTSSVCS